MAQGIVIGFSIAAPVGPIGILCIQRTLDKGRTSGFVSGLGAASADAVYGAIAGFGLIAISSVLINHQTLIRLLGGGFLLYLGVRTLRSEPKQTADVESRGGLLSDYGSTFLLTLTNPVTILAFGGIFTSLGVGIGTEDGAAAVLVIGVFTGSALWWLVLSGGVCLFATRITSTWMRRISQLAGVIIVGFGLLAFWSVVS